MKNKLHSTQQKVPGVRCQVPVQKNILDQQTGNMYTEVNEHVILAKARIHDLPSPPCSSPVPFCNTTPYSLLPSAIALRTSYDLVVIGSGPAGSTTAWYAAQNGASVLILERHPSVGEPVRCAEGVFQANLKEVITIPETMICSRISSVNIFAPDGSKVEMNSPETGFVLDRSRFDSYITDLAINAGTHLLTNANVTNVEHIDDSMMKVTYLSLGELHTVQCHIVIGADGVESQVGRWIGIDTTLALKDIDSCAQYRVENLDIQDDRCEVYFGNDIAPGGYAWIFPKSKTSANVGVGMCAGRKTDKNTKDYLDAFMLKHFAVEQDSLQKGTGNREQGTVSEKPDLTAPLRFSPVTSHHSPVTFCKSSFPVAFFIAGAVPISVVLPTYVANNVMLVGDAARQTNPLTGGGIEYAMQAGKIAGITAAKSIKAEDYSSRFLSSYQSAWDSKYKKKQEIAYLLKNKLYDVTDNRMNELFGELAKVPIQKLSYKALFFTILKNHPALLARIAKSYLTKMIH